MGDDTNSERDTLMAEIDRLTRQAGAHASEVSRLAGLLKAAESERAQAVSDAAALQVELRDVCAEARDRRHEARSLSQQVAELSTDRDGWKARAEGDADGLKEQLAAARATVRGMKHDRAYEKVARTLDVTNPAKYADLLKLAGHAPESDDPDEAAIARTFRSALEGRPWLVEADPASASATTTAAQSAEPGGSKLAPGGAHGAARHAPATAHAGSNGRPGPGADRGQSLVSLQSDPPPARKAGRI